MRDETRISQSMPNSSSASDAPRMTLRPSRSPSRSRPSCSDSLSLVVLDGGSVRDPRRISVSRSTATAVETPGWSLNQLRPTRPSPNADNDSTDDI